MGSLLLVVHVLAATALIVLVLIQHGRGADAGAAFGSGASGSLFGSRGPASFLTRVTAVLAATFFFTSLALAYLSTQSVERKSVTERVQPLEQPGPEQAAPPALPEVPTSPESTSSSKTPKSVGTTGFEVPQQPEASDAPSDVPSVPENPARDINQEHGSQSPE